MINAPQTLWICGREMHRPLIHSSDHYYDNPKKPKKGHFYFGNQGTFLFWVDIGKYFVFFGKFCRISFGQI